MIELKPVYDSAKSFYKKAFFEDVENQVKLYSYGTHVATIWVKVFPELEVFGTYSQTTLRHIKEFAKQHGFEARSKGQILKDYGKGK